MLLLAAAIPLAGRDKDKISYGEGLIVNIPLPESEVEQVVEDVAQNGDYPGNQGIQQRRICQRRESARPLRRCFRPGPRVERFFYKVREQAIDPRNFKDSGDVGTLVVRYVVQPQGEKNTVLRIDALFEEDFRHTVHPIERLGRNRRVQRYSRTPRSHSR